MYRWKLQIYNSTYDVSPTYSNAAVSEEREEGFMFLRKKMPNIRLTGRDFDLVNDGSIRYQYILILEELIDGDYQEVVRGKFSKLDCKIDADVRSLEVTPVTVDRYTTFLEGLDIEYDFLKYNPGTLDVRYLKFPILQLYQPGSLKITNIIGGRYWEQDCKVVSEHRTLVDDYKFSEDDFTKMFIAGVGENPVPDVTGEYVDVFVDLDGLGSGKDVFTRLSDSRYQIIDYGVVFDPDVTGDVGADLDQHPGNLAFTIPSATLTDDDFNSEWQVGSKTCYYIGYDPDLDKYCFRNDKNNALPTFPTGGTLVHVSGATNTGNQVYTGNPNSGQVYRMTIYDTVGADYVYLAPVNKPLNEIPTYNKGVVFTSRTSDSQVKLLVHHVYSRVLCDSLLQLGVLGLAPLGYDKPDDDITPPNDNYKYAAPISLNASQFVVSDENSVALDVFGIFSDDALYFSGNHFSRPSADTDNSLIPVNSDEWTEQSFWFDHDAATNLLQSITQTITLRHGYKLANVISVLLGQIDSNLTHQELEAYSDYLYGSSNPIRSSQRNIFITPKSNIIETNYNRPATKTKIKFREIIDMLANVYNAYIDIDEDNKFIIEGADFFLNGRSYSSTNPGINLSEILTTRHLGNLTDRKNIFSYEADAIPQRIMWKWMDEVSNPFEGVDMIGLDEYVTEGNVVTKNTGQFTSDIDYITVNGEAISKDGFVIMETTFASDVYTVSIWTDGGVDYQNGHLAISYMQQAYFIYNAICNTLNINGATHDISVDGGSVMRYKIQELKIPKIPNFDTRRLITTNLGSGLVREKTEDLSTGEINITIEHDTEL